MPVRRAQSRRQLLFQDGNVRGGPVVSPARTLARHIGRGDNVDLMAQVIEGQQPVEKHQYAIGQGKIILGMLANIFQLPHRVVGEVADRARGKRRQARARLRNDAAAASSLTDLNRAALALLLLLAALHLDVVAARPHLHVRTCSQKGVAADLLAPFHRLEQKGVGLIAPRSRGTRKPESTNRPPPISPPAPAWPLWRAGKIPCSRDEAWAASF